MHLLLHQTGGDTDEALEIHQYVEPSVITNWIEAHLENLRDGDLTLIKKDQLVHSALLVQAKWNICSCLVSWLVDL